MCIEELYELLKANTELYVVYNNDGIKKSLYTLEGGYDNFRLEIEIGKSYEFLYCEREFVNVYKEFESEDALCKFYVDFHLRDDELTHSDYWQFLKVTRTE